MGYYVVGEPIPLPMEKPLTSEEYLAYFPKGNTCIFFKKKEKAERYAKFLNATVETGVCPIFELEAIPEAAEVIRLKINESDVKAKQGIPKRHKAIASVTLDYLDSNNPSFCKKKFEKSILKKSFDSAQQLSSMQSPPDNSHLSPSPSQSILGNESMQGQSKITFAAITLAAVVSTLLWSTVLYYSSFPGVFIQTLATWGIIFVLPSSVLMAKIWFAFSLGTLATGALMGLYYGIKYTLKLLDLLISFITHKYQGYTQLAKEESADKLEYEPSYIYRLSQFIGQRSTHLYQNCIPQKMTTFSWENMKRRVTSLFFTEKPKIDAPNKELDLSPR